MKITNVNEPGETSYAIARGHTGHNQAGSPGITLSDQTGASVLGVTETTLVGAHAEDYGSGVGALVVDGLIMSRTAVGSNLSFGDVVVLKADGTVDYTTTARSTSLVGVVQRSTFSGDEGPATFAGFVSQVATTGTVNAGDYLETSATAGKAQGSPTSESGSFGVALEDGPDPAAFLFGKTEQSSGGGGGGGATSGVIATLTATQTPNADPYTIAWDATDVYDPDGYHDPSSNNSRLTVPAGHGGRLFIAHVQLEALGSGGLGAWRLSLSVNGTVKINNLINCVSGQYLGNGSAIIYLSDGDYVQALLYGSNGQNIISTDGTPFFSLAPVGTV